MYHRQFSPGTKVREHEKLADIWLCGPRVSGQSSFKFYARPFTKTSGYSSSRRSESSNNNEQSSKPETSIDEKINVSPIQITLQDLLSKLKNNVKVSQQLPHGARFMVAKSLGDIIFSVRNTT